MPPDLGSVRDQAVARYNALARRAGAVVGRTAADFTFRRQRVFYAPNPGVAVVADATVLSGEWLVLAGDYVLCDAFTQTPFPPSSAYHMGIAPNNGLDLIVPQPVRLDTAKAFLLGGCPNYSHWLMDYLPRLRLWRDGVPLLVNGPLLPFQTDSLQAAGVDCDRVVQLAYPNAYLVPSLQVPSLTSFWASVPPLAFKPDIVPWLRQTFAPLFANRPARRRIFISRVGESAPSGRRLLNDAEVADLARRHDFEVVACETLSFVQQVALFSEAAVIAGSHGAGLVNMAFAPPDARIIELMGPRGSDPNTERACYRQLAEQMGLRFQRVTGQSDATAAIENNHLVNERYTVDPGAITDVFARL